MKTNFLQVAGVAFTAALGVLGSQRVSAQENSPYRVEELVMPKGVAPEIGGLDFMPSGKLVVVTRRSGVWTWVPDKDPAKGQWRAFSGQSLHNPNGVLVVSDKEILVSQMPELTRIRDVDGDGEADEYICVTPFNLSGAYHEVTAGPVADGQGGYFVALNTASHSGFTFEHPRGNFSSVGRRGRNFSSVPYRGWVVRIDAKGNMEPWAKGFRSPNGIGMDSKGRVWVTDNQGDFRSTNPLYHVERGKFYGHPSSLVWDSEYVAGNPERDPLKQSMEELDSARVPEAVAFPYGFSRSPAQPLVDTTGGKFGPFAGQMLVADAAAPRIIRVMLEEVDGVWQGACADFYSENGLRNGSNRLVFSPSGNELYVGQTMREWAGAMEGLQRIVYAGGKVFEVRAMHIKPGGFELAFTEPVDPGTGESPEDFVTETYRYEYASSYGGPEKDLSRQTPSAVRWSADRRTVFLGFESIQPRRVYRVQVTGVRSGGRELGHGMVAYTVNKLPR
jgi:sugar lactone lactonase YvrE